MSIYDTLNKEQREAVYHTEGPLLILAGAGSGKTRVLTHRIAYLIDEKGVNPWNILAITFTNKAAGEMRERVDQIVGFGSESIWVSTFHSTCVRILRRHIDLLGYDTSFTIYDADDQKTLMKDVCKYLQIDTKVYKERNLLAAISSAKDELITPEEYELNAAGDFGKQKIAKGIYDFKNVFEVVIQLGCNSLRLSSSISGISGRFMAKGKAKSKSYFANPSDNKVFARYSELCRQLLLSGQKLSCGSRSSYRVCRQP